MKDLITSNVHVHSKRYIASGIAIILAVAFITVSTLIGAQFRVVLEGEFQQKMNNVDVSIGYGSTDETNITVKDPSAKSLQGDFFYIGKEKNEHFQYTFDDTVKALRSIEGIQAVGIDNRAFIQVRNDSGKKTYISISVLNKKPFTRPVLVNGKLPESLAEITLSVDEMDLLDVKIGDKLTLEASSDQTLKELTIVGVTKPQNPAVLFGANVATFQTTQHLANPSSILISAPGQDRQKTKQLVAQALVDISHDREVLSGTQVATYDENYAQMQSDAKAQQAEVSIIILIFPIIAMVVAIIVIATTFQIVMSRREKEFGLLRCIGMQHQQIKRMVFVEALIVGATASAIGIVVALVLYGVELYSFEFVHSFGGFLTFVDPMILVIGWVVGIVITLLASFASIRRSGAISPMAALTSAQAIEAPSKKPSRAVAIVGAVITLVGLAGIVVTTMKQTNSGTLFLLAVLSGIVLLLGLLMIAVIVMPKIIFRLSRLRSSRSLMWDMAGTNAQTFAGRTGSTAVALILGVSLCTMFIVGKSSLEATMMHTLDEKYAIDLTLTNPSAQDATVKEDPFTQDDLDTLRGVEGIAAVQGVPGTVVGFGKDKPTDFTFVIGRDELADISRKEMDPIADNEIILSNAMNEIGDTTTSFVDIGKDGRMYAEPDKEKGQEGEASPGDTQAGDASAGEVTTIKHPLKVEKMKLKDLTGFVNLKTFAHIAGDTEAQMVNRIYIKCDDDLSPEQLMQVLSTVEKKFPDASLGGAAPERVMWIKTLNNLMLVVLALLGVAVLVALVGVGNTMALSVSQRRNETGLLRALGLTKKQTRTMLLLESALLSVNATVVGIVLGIGFAIAGLYALPLEEVDTKIIDLPWLMLAIVLAVGVVSSLVATLLPARTAGKVSPIEAIEAP